MKTLYVSFLLLLTISITHAQYLNVRIDDANSNQPEEVSIAINPTNPNYISAAANINHFFRSTDAGLTWTTNFLSSSAYGVWGDPCIVYDELGYLYFGHLSNPPIIGYWIDRIVVQRSTDNGLVWNDGAGIGFLNPKEQDKEWLGVDMHSPLYKGNIYTTWTEFDNYGSSSPSDSSRIRFSRSTDKGFSWSVAKTVSDRSGDCIDEDNTDEGAVPCVGPDGEVYVSWAGPLGLMFDKSTDAGNTWGVDKFVSSIPGGWDYAVPGIYRANGLPITACDTSQSPFRGNIYINWSDQRNGTDNTDIFLAKSIDGGNTWSGVKKVNDDNSTRHQFFTWMTIDQTTGFIYFVFYDRRNTSLNLTDVYMARSSDGGETFTNFKVSESSFNPNSNVFFGDYTNIAAFNKMVYPVWMRLDGSALTVWTAIVNDSSAVIPVPLWTNQINVKDAEETESSQVLTFGQHVDATDSIDAFLGEYEPPPPPVTGNFDSRFVLPTNPEVGSLKDYRDSALTEITWELTFQPSSAGYPMTFSWDSTSFPDGSFQLTDVINGTIVNVNMRSQSSYTNTDPSITSLYIKYQKPTTFQTTVNISDGWNMVSVPGINPDGQGVNTWWPDRNTIADVYKWTGTYTAVTSATPTEGYWMLHTGANTYNTGDEWPAGGIQIVSHDPIPISIGWNMIGGYDNSAPVSGLTTTPPGLIVSGTVYGWNGSYYNPTNLVPGYGYWLLSTGNGVINLRTLAKGTSKLVAEDNREEWGKITLTDAIGKSYVLYAVNGEVNLPTGQAGLESYQLPPLPPSGTFDVRYSSGKKAEKFDKEILQTIEMRGITYPVKVRVEKVGIRITDETGKIVNERLKSGEEITISNSSVSKLNVSADLIPVEYALEQNYPNPFNPSTKIEYALPEDVNNVTLTIYNALGQRVAELVNSKMEAGYYSYVWVAGNVATGMYIYELRTDKFVSVKKMMLLK